jgi:uncharacterized protein (DUF2141 family)
MALTAQAADLRVTVSGVHETKETIRIALYAGEDGFRHEEHAYRVLTIPARTGDVSATFSGIAPGRYAVIAYHDENGNGRLDMMLGMFPDEGWGLSNDPTVIGPPSFDASAFEVAAEGKTIVVPLHY